MSGILTGLFEMRQTDYKAVEKALHEGRSASGVSVTQSSALSSSAVFASIRILAETLASLPLLTYEQEGKAKHRAQDFYLYPILHDEPNELMTSVEFIETLQGHLAGWGNAYCWIDYDEVGKINELWPLNPAMMLENKMVNKERFYHYQTPDMRMNWYKGVNVWHLRGLGGDGLNGYSVIGMMRQAIGLGMAAEEFGARFFGNDARPGMVLEHPGTLSDEAHKNLKASWGEEHEGLSKSHKIAILEEGLKIHEVGIPPEDAQFLETRKFQVTEIARAFRIPPHLLADLDRATFSNIEQQSLEFVIYTMMPWIVRWEKSIRQNLMLKAEKERYYAKFLLAGLLRGDTQSRYQAYAIARQNGWLSANDIRELEDMNPIDGGDVYLIPLNMVPAGSGEQMDASTERTLTLPSPDGRGDKGKGEEGALTPAPLPMGVRQSTGEGTIEERRTRKARERHRLMNSYRKIFRDTAARIMRREVQDVRGAGEKYLKRRDMNQFINWMDTFFVEHKDWIFKQMKPLYDSYADLVAEAAEDEVNFKAEASSLEAFVNSYLVSFAGRHAGTSQNKIEKTLQKAIAEEKDQLEALNEELDTWVEMRSPTIADEESVRSNNAIAVTVYAMAGVTRLMSVAFGKNCPYCSSLDGKIIGIDNFFITAGKDFQPEGTDKPLTSADNLRHAPYHGGCLPGSSLVTTVGFISAVSKRWFNGDLIVIHSARGHKLTCTPNHPVLTPEGWVAANRLNVGSYVISGGFGKRAGAIDEGSQDEPTRIEDIVKTFFDDPEVVSISVPLTAEDFHGDGGGSDVAVIGSYGYLRNRFDATRSQHLPETNFVGGFDHSELLACPSGHAQLFVSLNSANRSPVSSRSLAHPVIGGHPAGAQLSGLALTTDRNTSFDQPEADHGAVELQLVRERILGLSGEVFPDEIVKIDIVPFSGHVYNLQTEDGFYVADGIITHNCDCMTVAA